MNGQFIAEKSYLFEGEQQTVRQIADQIGIKPSTLHKRLKRHNDDIEVCVHGDFTHGKLIDLTGQTFGRLMVIGQSHKNQQGGIFWKCVCSCGNKTSVVGQSLRVGQTQSCGCLKREIASLVSKTHDMSKTPIWSIHRSMMDRCHLPSSHAYARYGGRGIKVCDRWHDFESFYADMGDKPEGMSLDRIDNDGDYCPDNVRWATTKEQANNRRNSALVKYGAEEMTIAQWADKAGMPMRTLWARIKRGVPFPICLLNIDLRYSA